jgi:hypothetical protein
MGVPAAKKPPRDATMRYIAKKKLWAAIAAECNIRPGAVRLWRKVPPLRVLGVERAIGRPRRLIRPDLYAEQPRTRREQHHGQAGE